MFILTGSNSVCQFYKPFIHVQSKETYTQFFLYENEVLFQKASNDHFTKKFMCFIALILFK